jgi:hypothetical protein
MNSLACGVVLKKGFIKKLKYSIQRLANTKHRLEED